MSWPQMKKIVVLKCHLLLCFATTTNHFLIGLWCSTKSGFYEITGNNQLSGWKEKKLQSTFQSQTCTKKRSWSLFGGLLLVWSTTAFWIPVKPLHLRSMLSILMGWLKIAMPAASTGQQNGPSSSPWFRLTAHGITNASKVKRIGLRNFTHLPYSPDLSPTDYHFFKQLFAGKMLPQPTGSRKCFTRVCQVPKHRFLHYRNKQTYLLLAKMCWLQWLLLWLIKMWLSLVIIT